MHDTRRVRLVLGILLIAAVALITIDFRDGGTSPARGVGSSVFGPVERVASDVTSPVSSVFDWVTGGPSADSKIASLQAANAKLRADLSAAQLSKADESQLSSLLKLAGRGGYRIVAASVIAAGQDYTDTVTLDVGRKDGVRAHETVLNGQGLVGTVTQVSADTSTVLLANDVSAVVGARLAGSNQIGSVAGTGKSLSGPTTLKLTLFAANAVLQSGQDLVTFGSVHDTPYVPGVPIGQVTKVEGNAGILDQDRAGQAVRRLHLTRGGRRGRGLVRRRTRATRCCLPPEAGPDRHGDRHPIRRHWTGTGTGTGATGTGTAPAPVPGAEVRRLILSVVLVAVALAAQLTIVNRLALPGGGGPDLVLLVVVALALTGGPLAGTLTGFLARLALDVAPPAGHTVGEYALVFCLVGYVCGRLAGWG